MAKAKKPAEQPTPEVVEEIKTGVVELVGLTGHMAGRTYRASEKHAAKLVEKGQAKYA